MVELRHVLPFTELPTGPPALNHNFILRIRHPENCATFLKLSAYDKLPLAPGQAQAQYGVCYAIVLQACQIIAYNKAGFLTGSPSRSNRIDFSDDAVLPAGIYYYHLHQQGPRPLYPICRDFKRWKFPHNNIPQQWEAPNPSTVIEHCSWTLMSQRIKDRDRDVKCRATGWRDGLTTAHVINRDCEDWLLQNDFELYLDAAPLNEDSKNLFALRWDLRTFQFDNANFVIVPKGGKFVIHFLRTAHETANLLHNVTFDLENTISSELLFARFAWALCKIVADSKLPASIFEFDESSEDGESMTVLLKRRRAELDIESPPGLSPEQERSNAGMRHSQLTGSQSAGLQRSRSEASDEVKTPNTADLQKANRTLPDLFNGSRSPKPREYENIVWYPGIREFERKKQEYFRAHPQIQERTGPFLPDDHDLDDDEIQLLLPDPSTHFVRRQHRARAWQRWLAAFDLSDVKGRQGGRASSRGLAEKARRVVEEAEKLEAMMGSMGRRGEVRGWLQPPTEVELSDESDMEEDEEEDGPAADGGARVQEERFIKRSYTQSINLVTPERDEYEAKTTTVAKSTLAVQSLPEVPLVENEYSIRTIQPLPNASTSAASSLSLPSPPSETLSNLFASRSGTYVSYSITAHWHYDDHQSGGSASWDAHVQVARCAAFAHDIVRRLRSWGTGTVIAVLPRNQLSIRD